MGDRDNKYPSKLRRKRYESRDRGAREDNKYGSGEDREDSRGNPRGGAHKPEGNDLERSVFSAVNAYLKYNNFNHSRECLEAEFRKRATRERSNRRRGVKQNNRSVDPSSAKDHIKVRTLTQHI